MARSTACVVVLSLPIWAQILIRVVIMQPYGASAPGATFKFTVLDSAGKRVATQVSQLAQAAYDTMQTPYSYFGLGRTNNYVEVSLC
jgi:hypothetical protein